MCLFGLFVCLFVCLFACSLACLFLCLFLSLFGLLARLRFCRPACFSAFAMLRHTRQCATMLLTIDLLFRLVWFQIDGTELDGFRSIYQCHVFFQKATYEYDTWCRFYAILFTVEMLIRMVADGPRPEPLPSRGSHSKRSSRVAFPPSRKSREREAQDLRRQAICCRP